MQEVSPAQFVIDKFGGLTKTANAIGIGVTTVQGWKARGTIPQTHWLRLIEAAEREGETIDLADFLCAHPSPKQESASA